MRPGMPPHERIKSAWLGRAIGSYFSHHGLKVGPNVRWAVLDDLDSVLDGIAEQGTIAISTQSLTSEPSLLGTLRTGLPIVIDRLKPQLVIIYGSVPDSLTRDLASDLQVLRFPTDISRAHSRTVK